MDKLVKAETGLDVYSNLTSGLGAFAELGKALFESRMFGLQNPAQGTVMALVCAVERKSPIEVLRDYHFTPDGKLLNRADSMQAKFQSAGGRIKWIVSNDKECKALFAHERCPDGFNVDLTFERFVENGVALGKGGQIKDVWKKFPAQMLRARAISEGVRAVYPECIVGLYTPEEAMDFGSSDYVEVVELPKRSPDFVCTRPEKALPPKSVVTSEQISSAIEYFTKFKIVQRDIENLLDKPSGIWGKEELKKLGVIKKSIEALETNREKQACALNAFNINQCEVA